MRLLQPALAFYRVWSRVAPRVRGRGLVLRAILALQRRGVPAPIVTASTGLRFELGTDWVVRGIFYEGQWEPEETALLEAATPRGGVFVDVGANVGYFTLLASRWVGASGRVHAFEPARTTHARLLRNLALNPSPNVSVHRLGVGAGEGQAQLVDEGDPGLAHLRASSGGTGQGEESIEVTTLDAFARREGLERLDVLKIDVEGADFEVLRGAADVLARFRPFVLLEVEHLGRFGASASDVAAYMARFGYDCEAVGLRNSHDMVCRPRERTEADAKSPVARAASSGAR